MSATGNLGIFGEQPHRAAGAWFGLSVAALALSSVYALILAIARSPVIGRLLPEVDLYHMALALHVDFAVLVWFLAFSGAIWSATIQSVHSRLLWAVFGLAGIGALLMALTPLLRPGYAVLNNYVPMIQSPAFLLGMSLFFAALVAVAAITVVRGRPTLASGLCGAVRWGIYLSVVPFLIAVAAFCGSLIATGQSAIYEALVWGPGHILQFGYVLMMMSAWLVLARAGEVPAALGRHTPVLCILVTAAPVLAAPLIYLAYPLSDPAFHQAFTSLMSYGTWPAALLLGLLLLDSARRQIGAGSAAAHARASLMLSVLLFAAGCISGAAISSNNVMVTSHYHGTTGAVSVAMMGLAVRLLPVFGFKRPDTRVTNWVPWVYATGLFLMLLGLAWSGGYNVQRKTPGTGLLVDSLPAWFGLAIVGTGGLVAVIGSLGFALPVLHSMFRSEQQVRATTAPPMN